MTDAVILSPNRTVESHPVTKTIAHGAASPGWIIPAGDPTYSVSVSHDDFNNTTLNGFAPSTETTSFEVEIDTGEMYLEGAWMARNTATTVTLDASTTTSLYVGYTIEQPDTILMGDETDVPDDPDIRRMHLYDIDTNASGVPNGGVTDQRVVGRRIATHNTVYDSDQSGVVDQAEYAQEAGEASSAQVADNADALGGAGPAQYARLDQDETVDSEWTHTLRTNFENTINVHGAQGHIDLFESDNNDKNWRVEVQGGVWRVVEMGVDEHLQVSAGGDIETSGRLGVSKSNPASTLDVGGATNIRDELRANNNDILNVAGIHSGDTEAKILINSGAADLSLQTGGGGNGQVRVWDNANDRAHTDFTEGGDISIPNGKVEAERGTAVVSGTDRRLWVGASFPAEAEDGDLLFEPQ